MVEENAILQHKQNHLENLFFSGFPQHKNVNCSDDSDFHIPN